MARKLFFNGTNINVRDLVIGNQDHIQLVVKGSVAIDGLIYCPKYSVKLTVQDNGTIVVHGVCKKLVLKKVCGIASLTSTTSRYASCHASQWQDDLF